MEKFLVFLLIGKNALGGVLAAGDGGESVKLNIRFYSGGSIPFCGETLFGSWKY